MTRGSESTAEILAGLVERVTFHSPESGFCVIRVKARGHRDLVTLVGHAAMISAGEWVTASGAWINDREHGLQFKAHFLKTSAPSTIEGIEKYLGSGMIRGIGPAYAKRLVKMFGKDVFDIIEAAPERLREVEGIGPKRAEKITAGWADQKVIREIMVFLHQHGVGTARAVRIFKTYGTDAVQVMSENPYRLAKDIRGIGFRTADTIAEKLGFEKMAMIRIRAGISFALTEAMGDGHCGLPQADLIGLAEKLLGVPALLIEGALAHELAEETVTRDRVGDTYCIFLTGLYLAERGIAEQLKRIRSGPLPWPGIDIDKALPWIEQKTALTLAPSQAEAIRLAIRSKLMVITGGPGVGKTTIVNSILRILAAKDVKLLLCAPTGRAARRMPHHADQIIARNRCGTCKEHRLDPAQPFPPPKVLRQIGQFPVQFGLHTCLRHLRPHKSGRYLARSVPAPPEGQPAGHKAAAPPSRTGGRSTPPVSAHPGSKTGQPLGQPLSPAVAAQPLASARTVAPDQRQASPPARTRPLLPDDRQTANHLPAAAGHGVSNPATRAAEEDPSPLPWPAPPPPG